MQSRILIGLALIASFAWGGDISSIAVSGGASGTKIRFSTQSELLSRVVPTPTGLRIDLLGATTELKGIHQLDGNPYFQEVRCSAIKTAQARLTRFEFTMRAGASAPAILHREWNGKDLDFVLDRKSVAVPFQSAWIAVETPEESRIFASLEKTSNLVDAKIISQGDLETVSFGFSSIPSGATLSGEGKRYDIHLGSSRVTSRFSGLGKSGLLTSGISSTTKKGETTLSVTFAETPRSVLLSRSGSVIQLRVVRSKTIDGVLSWNSKSSKAAQLISLDLPSDEVASVGSVGKGAPGKGSMFTPEGSQAAFHAQSEATNVGVGVTGNATESERLEAERRKSREFVQTQERQVDERESAEALKNRVVYNTFGIRDPFIPLEPDDVEGGLNIDQMRVVGIIYSPTRAMAVLEHITQSGLSVALKEGDAIQNGRVLQILRDRVVFVLEEFGVTRQFTLKLQVPKGEKS